MTVTLDISSRNIRMAAWKGNEIEKWETAALPAGAIKDGQIQLPQVVAEALNTLFLKQRLPRNEVRVCLTGLPYIYRILNLPKLKPGQMQAAVMRALRKEIQISLDELYIDWQTAGASDEEVAIFAVGVPRGPVDTLAQVLKTAGVNAAVLDLKPLALARAVSRSEALVANSEDDCLDIIIVADGRPVTLHAVPPKNKFTEPEDSLFQTADDMSRTVEFYNLTHKEKPIQSGSPVWLSGTLPVEVTDGDILPGTEYRIQKPAGAEKLPEGFSRLEYAANLGLYLKPAKTTKRSEAGYIDININLLAARRRATAKPLTLKRVLIPAGAAAAVLLLIPLSMWRTQTAAENSGLRAELEAANQTLMSERDKAAAADETEKLIEKLMSETVEIQKEQQIISGQGSLAAMVKTLTAGLPPATTFSNIKFSAAVVTVQGQAGSRQDVINYVKYLEKSGQFLEVRVAMLAEGETSCEFQIVIKRKGD